MAIILISLNFVVSKVTAQQEEIRRLRIELQVGKAKSSAKPLPSDGGIRIPATAACARFGGGPVLRTWRFMGSYNWSYLSPNMGYNYG